MNMDENGLKHRLLLKDKKRIVVKVGSSTLHHPETGGLDYTKLDKLVRTLCDLRNAGKDVVLVSSGAIAVGRKTMSMGNVRGRDEHSIAVKQACAAIGQVRLMSIYQKLFAEYNQITAQLLVTRDTVKDPLSRHNAVNTFTELLKMGVIPVVNENDTVTTLEIEIGDNDTLSAIVASLIGADLLILLSDIDGLYTDDPRQNPGASLISYVPELTEEYAGMGKGTTGSDVGTGGMNTKLVAARIAAKSGADMIIANGDDIGNINSIISGEAVGTLFAAGTAGEFDLADFLERM